MLKGFTHACTMNELNIPHYIVANKALSLDDPALQPKLAALEKAFGGPVHGMFLLAGKQTVLAQGLAAHQKYRLAIKEKHPDIPVGLTLSIQEEDAEPGADALCKQRRDEVYGPYLSAVKQDDFIGVQTYSRVMSRTDGSTGPADGAELTMMGYEDRPEALGHVLEYVWQETKTPLIVTENGFAGEDDSKRADFISRSIAGMKTAMQNGVQVDGYLYWSLFDNYEWMHGYKPRFGVIEVDRKTQRRLIKPSALTLAHYASQGSVGNEAILPIMSATGIPIGVG